MASVDMQLVLAPTSSPIIGNPPLFENAKAHPCWLRFAFPGIGMLSERELA